MDVAYLDVGRKAIHNTGCSELKIDTKQVDSNDQSSTLMCDGSKCSGGRGSTLVTNASARRCL